MTRRVIFLGTRPVGRRCLEILLARAAALDCEVIQVVTRQPANPYLAQGADVAAVAARAGIPVASDLDPAGPRVEILLSIEHEDILTSDQLARASEQAINLHMSPLPDYRGAGQCSFAILNQDREFGTTLHLMEPRVDAGGILAQRRFAIDPDWTVKELYEKTANESVLLVEENLKAMIHGKLRPRPQGEFPGDLPRRFYKRSDIPKYKEIDPTWPIERIDRTVRAFDMPGYEPAYIQFGSRRLYMRTKDLSVG